MCEGFSHGGLLSVANTSSPAAGILADAEVCYLHVGLQYGSPFRPTFSILKEKGGEGDTDRGDGYKLLEDCHLWMTAIRVANALKQSDVWMAQIYRLEDTIRPIPRMVPGVVSIRKADTAAVQIWPPAARAPRGGWGDDDDDEDDGHDGRPAVEDLPEGSDQEGGPHPPAPSDGPGAADDDAESVVLEDDPDAAREQQAREELVQQLLDDAAVVLESDDPGKEPPAATVAAEQPSASSGGAAAGRFSAEILFF